MCGTVKMGFMCDVNMHEALVCVVNTVFLLLIRTVKNKYISQCSNY